MTDIVDGFKNQLWRIIKFEGTENVNEQRIPLSEANEQDIVRLLRDMAKDHLTQEEIEQNPALYQVTKSVDGGNRITYTAGEDPHYVASLWRDDELSD